MIWEPVSRQNFRMAECAEYDFKYLCPICFESFKSPIMTNCKHNFCKQCLLMYIEALKEKGELQSSYPCPVCRQDQEAPEDMDIVSMIDKLPTNEQILLMSAEIGDVGTNPEIDETAVMCDPCSSEQQQIKAAKFCINCQEHLCKACVNAHKKFGPLKSHQLKDINADGIPEQIKALGITYKCARHQKDIEIYCKTHNSFSCSTCSTLIHRSCGELREISEMDNEARVDFEGYRRKYEIGESVLDSMINQYEEAEEKIPEYLQSMKCKLIEKRNSIVEKLDRLLVAFDVKSKSLSFETKTEIQENIKRLEKFKKSCQENEDRIHLINEYCLPVQIVMSQKSMKQEYLTAEKMMMKEQSGLYTLDLEWSGINNLERIMKDMSMISALGMQFKRGPKMLDSFQKAVAKNETLEVFHQIDHPMKLSNFLGNHVNLPQPKLRGIAIYDSSHLLLGSDSHYHVTYNHRNNTFSYMLTSSQPFSSTVLKSDPAQIVLSFPEEKMLKIVASAFENYHKVLAEYCLKDKPYSLISLKNGNIGVTCESHVSFSIVELTRNGMKTVRSYTQDSKGRKFKSFQFVALDEDRCHIIQPCYKEDAVFSFKYSGQPVFKYRDAALRDPQGVDIDQDGNIFVCSKGTNSIHVITPFGFKIKLIKCVEQPQAICFDAEGSKFWLSNTHKFKRKYLGLHYVSR